MPKPTAADKRHFQAVAELGCIICKSPYANIHHSRHGLGMGQRDHTKVIPLCKLCHQDGMVISRHGMPKEFRETYGSDAMLVLQVNELLGIT